MVREAAEANRIKLLQAVQEIRKQGGDLYSPQQSTILSLETRLLPTGGNPVTEMVTGRVDRAIELYRERLATGWKRSVVEGDISRQLAIATGQRRMILDSARRNPRSRPGSTQYWDDMIKHSERVLSEIKKTSD